MFMIRCGLRKIEPLLGPGSRGWRCSVVHVRSSVMWVPRNLMEILLSSDEKGAVLSSQNLWLLVLVVFKLCHQQTSLRCCGHGWGHSPGEESQTWRCVVPVCSGLWLLIWGFRSWHSVSLWFWNAELKSTQSTHHPLICSLGRPTVDCPRCCL